MRGLFFPIDLVTLDDGTPVVLAIHLVFTKSPQVPKFDAVALAKPGNHPVPRITVENARIRGR